MSEYKLNGIYKIKGQIKLETGLHIGGDEGVIEIEEMIIRLQQIYQREIHIYREAA